VIAGALGLAICGCASILGIDGDYAVGGDGGDDGSASDEASRDGSSSGGHDAGDSGIVVVDSSDGSNDSGSDGDSSSKTEASTGDKGIACGPASADVYCNVGTQVCCVGASASAQACTAVGACPSPLTPMKCDDTADCPSGQVCCGQLTAGGTGYTSVSCQATCGPISTEHQLCDPKVHDCPTGLTCTPSTLLPGHSVCL
jgi:hypothetical protein